jgi:hypothetical protein
VAYFDRSGFTTNLAGGYYKVTLYFKPETVPLAAVSTVTATVVWPAQSAAPLSTIVFVTKVAQYTQ